MFSKCLKSKSKSKSKSSEPVRVKTIAEIQQERLENFEKRARQCIKPFALKKSHEIENYFTMQYLRKTHDFYIYSHRNNSPEENYIIKNHFDKFKEYLEPMLNSRGLFLDYHKKPDKECDSHRLGISVLVKGKTLDVV